jgi:hypothetical protein
MLNISFEKDECDWYRSTVRQKHLAMVTYERPVGIFSWPKSSMSSTKAQ